MSTATVTSKGQITIPAAIRSDLHIGPGDRVEFVRVGDGRKPVSVEAMNRAIRKRASGR
ncbi:AbrB/MazE/SpoVT family DNA-binding domain-containing protein [Microbulbifer sp.]|uniref:AbrB/MazE/SpoVT family DNA-binding domain-containing protein n=1 Tax=Microbulbifer sp. TaxID=1908541 RepID=UPI003F2C8838